MYSVRRRLLIILALGFAALIVGSGFFMLGILEERVTEEFDHALVARARALAALTEEEDGQIEFDYTPEHLPEFEREDDPDFYHFFLDDGRSLLRSARLQAIGADLPNEPQTGAELSARDVALPDGRAGRMVVFAFDPKRASESEPADAPDAESVGEQGDSRGLILAVARGRSRLDSMLGTLRLTVFGIGLLAALLAVLFAWRVLKRGFRPIDSIATQVRGLDADRLGARVELARTPAELAPVLDQLNALLQRLDASFERERRFTGNVAHELRTPIAELRSLALVGSRWPDDRESVTAFFGDVKDIAGRMEGVIGDLLLLARCEAGVEQVKLGDVRLTDLISETWARLEAQASIHGIGLDLDLANDIVVESDPTKLELIVGNLLGNAVSYALPDTRIRCAASVTDGALCLELSNLAERLTPDELACLSEPFWRKEEARSAAEHAGLGLSLVTALAALLRLNVRFDQDADGRFLVRIDGWTTHSQRVLEQSLV